MLSREQFGEVAANLHEHGGDSINVVSGERPTEGYMVSRPNSEHSVPASEYTPREVVKFARSHKEPLLTDPRAHLGVWRDPTGRAVQDVSDQIDDYGTAMTKAKVQNQQAIYGVHEEETYLAPPTSRQLQRKKLGLPVLPTAKRPGRGE